MNPGTGDILAQEQAQAASKEQVLHALGRSCKTLREKLGESLTSIKRFDKPLKQANTPSLEALQLYTLGLEKLGHEGNLAAIPFFQRAVQIDPNFALAYARLGTGYANLEQWQSSEQYENKAIALIDRVSDRERLYITGHHYNRIGDTDKEIQTYEEYARLYPQDAVPHGNLAFNYSLLGQYEKSIDHALMGMRANPDAVELQAELAESYEAVGKVSEAKAILVKGSERNPENWDLRLHLSNIALVEGDTAAQRLQDTALKSSPQGTLNLLYRDAALAASRGQLRNARELYSQTRDLSLKLHLVDNASFAVALQAVYEAYHQDYSAAKRTALAALKLSRIPDTLEPVAVALAVARENQQAQALVSQLAKQRPDDTFAQFVYVPMIAALIDLNSSDGEKALQDLRPSIQYDRGNLDPMLVRANAYLMAKRTSEAADEYRRILALKARFPYDPVCSLAQLGLARTYALAGDASRSQDAYKVFLALWKDADPDLPVLKQAKSEYAALQLEHCRSRCITRSLFRSRIRGARTGTATTVSSLRGPSHG